MKYLFTLLLSLVGFGITFAQTVQSWYGILSVQGFEMPLAFHIHQQGDSLFTLMDSPEQKVNGLPFKSTTIVGDQITISDPTYGITYTGTRYADSVVGVFEQGGMKLPFTLYKAYPKIKKEYKRPQTPQPPYNYPIDTVMFTNPNDGVVSRGVLSRPSGTGKHPLVILVSGSGSQDMDVTLFDHKLFAVIAHYLTQQGIAVFRFDDRGVDGSGGVPKNTTTAIIAQDVLAAHQTLQKRFNSFSSFGVLGHSQGSNVAVRIAANKAKGLDYVLLLAGPGAKGSDLILEQYEVIGKLQQTPDSIIQAGIKASKRIYQHIPMSNDSVEVAKGLMKEVGLQWNALSKEAQQEVSQDNIFKELNNIYNNPSILETLTYNPIPDAQKVKCPTFILNGDLDVQVKASTNAHALANAIRQNGNKQVQLKIYPYLNHLFQYAVNGTLEEYEILEETINEEVLKDIGVFILANGK